MRRINVENVIIDRTRIVNNIENMFGCKKQTTPDIIEEHVEYYEPTMPDTYESVGDSIETIVIDTDNNEL